MRILIIISLLFIFIVACGSNDMRIKGAKPSLPRGVGWFLIRSPQTDNCYEVIWSQTVDGVAMAEIDSDYCLISPVRSSAVDSGEK